VQEDLRRPAAERLQHDRTQAQRAVEALAQTFDLGSPGDLVQEIESRLRRQRPLLGKISGCMAPALFGCRTPSSRQVHSEDAYYGHLVLRLIGGFVLCYGTQVVC